MTRTQIGQYLTPTLKLLRCLGSGAMGTVWTAEDLGLRRQVAVKVMTPGYVDDDDARQRFHKEAQAAGRIRSPYIATIFGHGVSDEGQPFITMELLDGETLRQRLARLGPLPVAEVVRLFGQIAKGIAAAHKHGVVHRDIKPANLFVIDDGGEPFIKVLDFGIAKQLDATSELTSTSAIMGTAAYMSPEQFHDTKRVDHRTDLWALGVVVYELLTGKTPFTGPSFWAVGLAVVSGEFPPPSTLRRDLPNALDRWVAKALSLDIDARFGSALEMAEMFAAAAKSAMEQPEPKHPTTTLPAANADMEFAGPEKNQPLKANPNKPKQPLLGDLLRAGARGRANVMAPQKEELRLDVVEDPSQSFCSLSLAESKGSFLIFDKTGESLFIAFSTGEMVCFALQTNQVRWWARVSAKPLCMDASTAHLAVGCANGTMHVFDSTSGQEQNVFQMDSKPIPTLAIDATGRTLAMGGETNCVTFVRVATGECIHVADAHTDVIRALAYDARNGVWASGARDTTVRIWDGSFRQIQVLRGGVVRCAAFAADGSYFAAGYNDGSAILWSTRSWEFDKKVAGHKDRINSLAFLPGVGVGGAVVAGSNDGTLGVWGVATGRCQVRVGDGATPVLCVSASRDGRYIASLLADGTVRLYRWPISSNTGEPRRRK